MVGVKEILQNRVWEIKIGFQKNSCKKKKKSIYLETRVANGKVDENSCMRAQERNLGRTEEKVE